MDIYFQPTYLYIKKHNKTGLKYFGRTTSDNPVTYQGSGNYWRRHLKKHGNDVSTLWYHLYDNKEIIKEEALAFSSSHNIVDSTEWANLMPEDGINGSVVGRKTKPCSEETKRKLSEAHKRRTTPRKRNPHSEETKEKIRNAIKLKGTRSEETKLKLSIANKGKTHSAEAKEKIRNASIGRKCPKTAEHRKKLSIANTGKTLSAETREKISQALKGNPKNITK
jgi:hypothetical protein